ncbi:MAG: tail fiber domain-containing protein [Rhodanobacteraceae bacterium]
MKLALHARVALVLGCAIGIAPVTQAAQAVRLSDTPIRMNAPENADAATLSLALPDGQVLTSTLQPGQDSMLPLSAGALADGIYRYQITYAGQREQASLTSAKDNGRAGADTAATATGSDLPAAGMTSSGSFRVVDGAILRQTSQPEPESTAHSMARAPAAPSQTISGDLTVYNSACIGFDCAAAESYGRDTLRLKENNTQINFADTSNSAGFPSNDWTLRANDSDSGGMNRFMLVDVTGNRIPVSVQAGARDNALFVSSNNRIGFGTTTPVLPLDLAFGDTPGLRLNQDGSAGWTAQVWDVAANEANFFVRDVTHGSLLPFRIKPGANTGTLAVGLNGSVGVGMNGNDFPGVTLDVRHNQASASPVDVIRVTNADSSITTGQEDRFVVDSNGNVTARGTIVQLSSRTAKNNFTPVDDRDVLTRVAALKIGTWNYKTDPASDRHMGPVAEDFHQQFQLGGQDNKHIAVTDMGGVALAAVQALQKELQSRDKLIKALEQRVSQLEAMQGAHPTAQR